MNFQTYPWLNDLGSDAAQKALSAARERYLSNGAATFPDFIDGESLKKMIEEARSREDDAFTTDDTHTPHLLAVDDSLPNNSVRNFEMRTKVASIAYDELRKDSSLATLYRDPKLLRIIAAVTGKKEEENLFLSDDPIGCCTVNVFRGGYYHSFHFDESEFSTTLMLQEAEEDGSGLFQYTNPLRQAKSDLALDAVASMIRERHLDDREEKDEAGKMPTFEEGSGVAAPELLTLDFKPGTLSIFSGSRSLHRVTRVDGEKSRLTAVLTFASRPGFRNSKEVQELFWGRSSYD